MGFKLSPTEGKGGIFKNREVKDNEGLLFR